MEQIEGICCVRNRQIRTQCAPWLLLAALMTVPSDALAVERCAISGRVIDRSGAPIPSATVTALHRGGPLQDLAPDRRPVSGAIVNSRGEYCIGLLPPGEYIIRAAAMTHPPTASPQCADCCESSLTGFRPTFHRASVSERHALALAVENGKSLSGIDITMPRERVYCLRGEVRDGKGLLLTDVSVALETNWRSTGVINEGGRFLLTNLLAGTYTLVLTDRPQPGRVLARQVIQVPAGKPATITLRTTR